CWGRVMRLREDDLHDPDGEQEIGGAHGRRAAGAACPGRRPGGRTSEARSSRTYLAILFSESSAMRTVKAVFLVLGAALLGVLVYRVGAEPILQTLRRLTWWQFVLVCMPYAIITAVDTLGWRFAFARDRAPFWRLYGARLAGEALNVVTAVGAVGGEAAKTWLVRRDVEYEESVPSIVIAKTTITIAQALFLLIGLGLAWLTLPAGADVLRGMLWLLVVEVLAVGGFVGAQVAGLVARGGRLLRMFGALEDTAYAETLDRALRHYYRKA